MKFIASATVVALVTAPTLVAAQMPSVTPISCASPVSPVKVTSAVASGASSAKVYFKAAGQQAEYYVDMRRAADGSMWAFIPAPLESTRSFTYRVISMDAKTVQTSSPLFTATTAVSCELPSLTQAEQRYASNMIIGMTTPGQPVVPIGFQCRGVVSYITSAGNLHQNDECRRIAALGPQTSAGGDTAGINGTTSSGTASSGTMTGSSAMSSSATGSTTSATTLGGESGLSTATVIAITGGAFALGAVIGHNAHHNSSAPVSPSRP